MDRRHFVGSCSLAGAALGVPAAFADTLAPRSYPRARLLDADGKPLKAARIAAKKNYVFHYPYAATPCFLLNVDRAAPPAKVTGETGDYKWPGGVGVRQQIVAYSAICAHQLAYPTKEISFISFRAGKAGANQHADVIHCCAEHSQYDPAAGAKVLAGPAPQPLAAILLEHDPATDELTAVGTLGTEMFNSFFKKYELKLDLEHNGKANTPSGATVSVQSLDNFCRQQVRC